MMNNGLKELQITNRTGHLANESLASYAVFDGDAISEETRILVRSKKRSESMSEFAPEKKQKIDEEKAIEKKKKIRKEKDPVTETDPSPNNNQKLENARFPNTVINNTNGGIIHFNYYIK